MEKNLSNYENYLNDFYTDSYSLEQAIENLIYLTNKNRGNHISKNKLIAAYHNRQLGTVLKKYDSVAYHVGFNDWK